MGGPLFSKTKDLGVISEILSVNHWVILGRIKEAPNLVLLTLLVNSMAVDQYNVSDVEGGATQNAHVHLS